MRELDADLVIVGGGPTGLMLATELGLAGLRPLVLEREPRVRDTLRAGGLAGQILQLLHYRGVLDGFSAAGTAPVAARFPFGGMHLDFGQLDDSPMRALQLPQPQLERLLDERARELGADVRRGHEAVRLAQDLDQDAASVTAEVRGPDGPYRITARYLVGCDGGRSRVRDMAGIRFPGTTYPEVNRMGQVTALDSVTRLDNGDLDVPGVGRIPFGYTWTDRGVFAFGSATPEVLGIFTAESQEVDDNAPMTLAELRDSVGRVLGVDLPLGEPIRLTRYRFQARQAERYRAGRVLLAGDAAHLFPAGGVALNAGLLDAVNLAWKLAAAVGGWAPAGLLDTYDEERRVAGERTLLHTRAQAALRRGYDADAEALRRLFLEMCSDEQPLRRVGALFAGTDIRYPMPGADEDGLVGRFAPDLALRTQRGTASVADLMHTARPVLLDLADRRDLRDVARAWRHRVDIHTAETDHRPADALLIRPDAHIAWAAARNRSAESDEPAGTALREPLARWFGAPA